MRILMTGATDGIGLEAAKKNLAAGAELTIGVRTAGPNAPAAARTMPLDLASLASVRAFAEAAASHGPFDALLLNAGMQITRPARSQDGFDLTFAVNHLAHYLLARLAAPSLATGGRVILTSSGTHDPEEVTGIPAPRHCDARRLAYPESDPELDVNEGVAGRRAYSTSKLCNVMTARELARRLAPSRPDIAVAAFDPGFTPGTGLARDYPAPLAFVFRRVLPALPLLGERQSTPRRSGGFLGDLAIGRDERIADARGTYFSVRGPRLEARAVRTGA